MTPAVVVIAPLVRPWWGGPPVSEHPIDRLPAGRVVFGEGQTVEGAQVVAALLLDALNAVAQAWPGGAAARAALHGRWN